VEAICTLVRRRPWQFFFFFAQQHNLVAELVIYALVRRRHWFLFFFPSEHATLIAEFGKPFTLWYAEGPHEIYWGQE